MSLENVLLPSMKKTQKISLESVGWRRGGRMWRSLNFLEFHLTFTRVQGVSELSFVYSSKL